MNPVSPLTPSLSPDQLAEDLSAIRMRLETFQTLHADTIPVCLGVSSSPSSPSSASSPRRPDTLSHPSLPMLRILSILEDTMVDGPGFRTSVYAAGCRHACPGCHNLQSWDMNGGREMTVEEIMEVIEADRFADVTFSGGDPFFQAQGFVALATAIRKHTHKTIWCYTGFTWEQLTAPLHRPISEMTTEQYHRLHLLSLLDTLVDGPYVAALRNTDLQFRGSGNQRIIKVKG